MSFLIKALTRAKFVSVFLFSIVAYCFAMSMSVGISDEEELSKRYQVVVKSHYRDVIHTSA